MQCSAVRGASSASGPTYPQYSAHPTHGSGHPHASCTRGFPILTCGVICGVEVDPLVESFALSVRALTKNKTKQNIKKSTASTGCTRRYRVRGTHESTRRTRAHDTTRLHDARGQTMQRAHTAQREHPTHREHAMHESTRQNAKREHTTHESTRHTESTRCTSAWY